MKKKPNIAQKKPYLVDLEEGKTYFWCQCGKSDNQPYCDGNHKTTPFKPKQFKAEKKGKAYLCGCKQTSNQPYCDGTHKKLSNA